MTKKSMILVFLFLVLVLKTQRAQPLEKCDAISATSSELFQIVTLSDDITISMSNITCLLDSRLNVQLATFAPPENGFYQVQISSVVQGIDSVMEVVRGTCHSSEVVDCNDDLDLTNTKTGFNSIFLECQQVYTIKVAAYRKNIVLPSGSRVSIQLLPCNYSISTLLGPETVLSSLRSHVLEFTPFETREYYFASYPPAILSISTGTVCPYFNIYNTTVSTGSWGFDSILLVKNVTYSVFVPAGVDKLFAGTDYHAFVIAQSWSVILTPPILFFLFSWYSSFRVFREFRGVSVHELKVWRSFIWMGLILVNVVFCTCWALPYISFAYLWAWFVLMELSIEDIRVIRRLRTQLEIEHFSKRHSFAWLSIPFLIETLSFGVWNLVELIHMANSRECNTNGCFVQVWIYPIYGALTIACQLLLGILVWTKFWYEKHMHSIFPFGYSCPHCQALQPPVSLQCPSCDLAIERHQLGIWRKCPQCFAVIEKNGGCDHMKCTSCDTDFQWLSATFACPACRCDLSPNLRPPNSRTCVGCRTLVLEQDFRRVPAQGGQTRAQEEPTSCTETQTNQSPQVSPGWISEWLRVHDIPSSGSNIEEVRDSAESEHEEYFDAQSSPRVVDDVIDESTSKCGICLDHNVEWQLQCGHQLCNNCLVKILYHTNLCPFDRIQIETEPVQVSLQAVVV